MPYLFLQIFLCLLIAFLIGLFIGWWMGRRSGARRVEALGAELDATRAALQECRDARSKGGTGSSSSPGHEASGSASAAPLAAAAMPAVAAKPDDLKRVWGIGPKMEEILNGAGIHTFDQLSRTSVERLQEIVSAYGSKRLTDIANEEVWPEQAGMAARGEWAALEAYQSKLSWREGGGKPQEG